MTVPKHGTETFTWLHTQSRRGYEVQVGFIVILLLNICVRFRLLIDKVVLNMLKMSAATLAVMLMASVHICHGKISVTCMYICILLVGYL